MKKIIFLVLLAGLVGCGENKYDKCVSKGIQYFKDIESYPNLSDGRNAEKVAEERCHRSRVAFGSLD